MAKTINSVYHSRTDVCIWPVETIYFEYKGKMKWATVQPPFRPHVPSSVLMPPRVSNYHLCCYYFLLLASPNLLLAFPNNLCCVSPGLSRPSAVLAFSSMLVFLVAHRPPTSELLYLSLFSSPTLGSLTP